MYPGRARPGPARLGKVRQGKGFKDFNEGDRVKIWHLKTYPYPIRVVLLLSKRGQDARNYLAKKYPSIDVSDLCHSDGCSFYFHKGRNRRVFFVWISKFSLDNIDSITTLGHEIFHTISSVFNFIGLEEKPSGEAGAYYFDYLFRQALKKLTGGK